MDLCTDFFECFTAAHQRWQVPCSTDKVCVEHARELCLKQPFHLIIKSCTDDVRFMLGLLETELEGVYGGGRLIWFDGPRWEYIFACACLVVDTGLNQEAVIGILFVEHV